MPKLYENMEIGTIGAWQVSVGDEIAKGQPLVELITDKMVEEFSAPVSGTVRRLRATPKSELAVGAPICDIGAADEELPGAAVSAVPSKTKPEQAPGPDQTGTPVLPERLRAAPAARALAKKHNIDLAAVSAWKSSDGPVHKQDVEAYISHANSNDTKGPVVLITGASGDIGMAVARAFVPQGYRLALQYHCHDIDQTTFSSSPAVKTYGADLTSGDETTRLVESVVKDFGQVDVLVTCCGAIGKGPVAFTSDEEWHRVLDLNLSTTFYMLRAVSMVMARQRRGRIICVGSAAGQLGAAGKGGYAAAKAGLLGLVRTSARELAGSGVTVNLVSPGFVESKMTSDLEGKALSDIKRQIPLRRMAQPAEIAAVIAFLAGGGGSYITGQNLAVDGGLCMG